MAYATPADARGTSNSRLFVIISFVLSAIAVFLLPIVFGPAAIVTGAVGLRKGDPLGRWAVGVAVVATILGFVLGAIVYNASN
jgi:hypothetical protein